MEKLLPCPICSKEFEKEVIEKHVNKCIFLNTTSENTCKRNASPLSETGCKKKIKVNTSIVSNSSVTYPEPVEQQTKFIPLAESTRPTCLDDIIGQKESFGVGSILHSLLSKKKIPNMILWGPPGCGKTTLANVISQICKEQSNLRFVKLSATTCGISDVKEAVKVARNEAQYKRHTIMFMDKVHRFNKLQQDTFLPHVEDGTITLVGATTENPSFSLNNALLSHCKVFMLSKLLVDDVCQILERTILKNNLAVIVDDLDDKMKSELDTDKYIIEKKSLRWLAEICDGDARVALGALELVLNVGLSSSGTKLTGKLISLENLKNGFKRSHMLYDRIEEEHYTNVSAIQKSIRASDDNAALYWTTRALRGGEDPLYIARRLVRTAAEDVGLADPNALVEAVACLQGCQHIGMPESDVLLAQCAVRLARAEKSHEVDHAMKRVQRSLTEAKEPLPPVPLHLRYGKGYNTLHREQSGLTYMPEGLENVNFFDDEEMP